MSSDTNTRRPRIGVTTYLEQAVYGVWNQRAAIMPSTYTDAVLAGGGAPILLPPAPGCEEEALDSVHALIVSGGPDIDPSRYGQQPSPETGTPNPLRDEWETELLTRARRRGMPILAICRGMQLLNVTLGGTLHQHLGADGTPSVHRPEPGSFGHHAVTLYSDTQLAGILGRRSSVRCHHHQALDSIAPGLKIVGRAEDGTVEAVEDEDSQFCIGVQWHPEENSEDVALVHALASAAVAWRDSP